METLESLACRIVLALDFFNHMRRGTVDEVLVPELVTQAEVLADLCNHLIEPLTLGIQVDDAVEQYKVALTLDDEGRQAPSGRQTRYL